MASIASKNKFITDLNASVLFIHWIPDSHKIYSFDCIIKWLIKY